MARSKHTHKFICVGRRGYDSKIWKCALPDCTWFVHLGLSHVMLGKPSTCWECDETFLINDDSLKDDMPKCADCMFRNSSQSEHAPASVPVSTTDRTPEQQIRYEKEMKELFGKDWRKMV